MPNARERADWWADRITKHAYIVDAQMDESFGPPPPASLDPAAAVPSTSDEDGGWFKGSIQYAAELAAARAEIAAQAATITELRAQVADRDAALKVLNDERTKGRPFIAIDPAMRSGEPTINHTRLPVDAVLGVLAAGESIEHAMDDYDVTRADILVACWYEGTYGSRKRRRQLGAWAKEAHGLLWNGKFDEVTDPFEEASTDD